MTDPGNSIIYEFDDFRFAAKSQRLYRRGDSEPVPLQPKAAALLLFLITSDGRLLTKNEILEAVWEDSFVEESNLSQTVFVLRKALGENSKEPRFVLTVPNRGYQFIAPVKKIEAENKIETENKIAEKELLSGSQNSNPEKPLTENRNVGISKIVRFAAMPLILVFALVVYWFYPAAKPATVSDVKSIAVLPFEELNVEQTEKYLGGGLTDALINKLSGLKQIIVRPSRTVAKYADSREDASVIGRELQVDAVLDGRIQRVGERVGVSVQLIRTADNATLWTANFDDEFSNLFAVQDSISRKVVSSLAIQLDAPERQRFERRGTENAAAYEEYLRGRFFWNKRTADGLEKAVEHFNRAVEYDPNFAQAHSALAETYVLVNLYGAKHDPNAMLRAKAAAERALQLDDQSAEAHAALAQVKMQYEFDWAGTESEYKKAIELDPNSATVRQWYGEFLALQERTDESLPQMEKALQLDPTSLSTNNAMALTLLKAREPDKALAVTEKVLQMDANFPWALHYRCRAFLQKGELENAIEFCRKALAVSNESLYMKSNLAYVLARGGRQAEARQILAELQTAAQNVYVSPYNFALIHNALGEKDATFKYLNKAVEERDFLIPALKSDFVSLRDDPQFIEILRRVNF